MAGKRKVRKGAGAAKQRAKPPTHSSPSPPPSSSPVPDEPAIPRPTVFRKVITRAQIKALQDHRRIKVWNGEGGYAQGIDLQNNHCYRNAVYAALLHNPDFMELVRQHDSTSCSNLDICLWCRFAKLDTEYWTDGLGTLSEDTENSALAALTELIDTWNLKLEEYGGQGITATLPSWTGTPQSNPMSYERWSKLGTTEAQEAYCRRVACAQQDASEFLGWLLECLKEMADDKNAFDAIFRFSTSIDNVCPSCKNETPSGDSELLGPLNTTVYLTDDNGKLVEANHSLHYYLEHKALYFEVQRACSNPACVASTTTATPRMGVQTNFTNLAKYFIVSPQSIITSTGKPRRGQSAILAEKVQKQFTAPLWLDLGGFMDATADRSDTVFKLWSVVDHAGTAGNSGHYTGTYSNPLGIRRIDNALVQYSAAMHLSHTLEYRARPRTAEAVQEAVSQWDFLKEKFDGQTTQAKGKTKNSVLAMNPSKISNGAGKTPLLLIYKRIVSIKTRTA